MNDLTSIAKTEEQNGAKKGTVIIELPTYDCDINLQFPNGQRVELKYQMGVPSLEIQLPEQLVVTNWNDNMEPAEMMSGLSPNDSHQFAPGHVRLASQIIVDLRSEYFMHSRGNN